MIDTLELRLFLSVSTTLDKGLLTIQGSDAADVINVDLANAQVMVSLNSITFGAPVAQVKRIRVLAGAGNDRVTFTDAVNIPATIMGGAGDDYLRGGSAACQLFGEAGNDTLVGGTAADVFSGGLGIDIADYSARTENLQLSLDGKANDGVPAAGVFKGERDNLMPDIEVIIGGLGNDRITGGPRNDTVIGGAGNDTLVGLAGDDVLVGGPGADLLQGGAGNDVLIDVDGANRDTLDGGEGFDSVSCDSITGVKDTLLGVENTMSVLAAP